MFHINEVPLVFSSGFLFQVTFLISNSNLFQTIFTNLFRTNLAKTFVMDQKEDFKALFLIDSALEKTFVIDLEKDSKPLSYVISIVTKFYLFSFLDKEFLSINRVTVKKKKQIGQKVI